MKWFIKVLRHYADFSGRARRKEYWMFALFNTIFFIAACAALVVAGQTGNAASSSEFAAVAHILPSLYTFVMLLPGMAVTVRRLHDLGKSGWWLLVGLIPLVGGIWLFALMVTEGERGDNWYGPNPRTFGKPVRRRRKRVGIVLTLACVGVILGILFYQMYQTQTDSVPVPKKNDSGEYGFVNEWKMTVIPFKYQNAKPFIEGLALVRLNGKWGLIDRKGREVIPCKYDDVLSFSEGMAQVWADGKGGYIDLTGREVIPCKYEHILPFSGGLAAVKLDGKYGLIDKTGAEAIPFTYHKLTYHATGYYETELNGKKGVLDKQGTELQPPAYDEIDFSSGVLMRFKQKGKYGFLNSSGKEAVAAIYDDADVFSQGKAGVELKTETGFIDATGKYTFSTRKITLVEAVRQKLVKFSAQGSSISESYMEVRNLTDKELYIQVPAGTFLAAHSSSDQNMVLTSPVDFRLKPNQEYSQSVSTACMNIHRDIPGTSSGFGISQRPESHLLTKVIKRLNEGDYSYSVIQAAVWIVTDGASYGDVGTLSSGGNRVIDRDDYDTALRVVREAQRK